MILFCLGPNTFQFHAAVRLLVELSKEILGDVVQTPIEQFDDFRSFVVNNKSRNVIFYGPTPAPMLAETIIKSNALKIVLTQEAISVVAELMTAHKMDLLSAVRIHSLHFAALETLVGAEGVHFLALDGECRRASVLLRAFADILGHRPSPESADALLRRLYGDVADLEGVEVSMHPEIDEQSQQLRDGFDPRDANAIDTAFPPIQRLPDSGFRWVNRFFYGPSVDIPGDEPIPLLGRARTIFFGPFMYLPPGDWRATYKLNIARNWSGNVVIADIQVNLAVVAVGKLPLPKEGSFEFSLDFAIETEIRPVEMRLHLLEGAIQGFLELVEIQVSRR